MLGIAKGGRSFTQYASQVGKVDSAVNLYTEQNLMGFGLPCRFPFLSNARIESNYLRYDRACARRRPYLESSKPARFVVELVLFVWNWHNWGQVD